MNISALISRLIIAIPVVFIIAVASSFAYTSMRAQATDRVQTLEGKIYASRVFEEPLVPMGATTAAEDRSLLRAIQSHKSTAQPANFGAFNRFFNRHPNSAWRVAMLTNEGLADYRAGYFDRAIAAYGKAWRLGKDETGIKQKRIVDRAIGELIRMHARLGHAAKLSTLLAQIKGRPMSGRAAAWVEGAKEGLYEMRNNPGVAYLCGPMAVKNVLLALHPGSPKVTILDAYRSGPHGVNLETVAELAKEVGLDYRMAYNRNPGKNLPLPAVVHWRVNHYAAVIGFANGRYHVEDPTFGHHDLWITPAALAAESDGYYLIPNDAMSAGWAAVNAGKANSVYGMGYTNSSNPYATTPRDVKACDCHSHKGLPVANAATLLASLQLNDTPLSYTPPKGPAVKFMLTYNFLDVTQPANFSYSNLGPQWSTNWIAFIQDDPNNPSANIERVFGGGGAVIDSGCSSWNCQFTREALTGDILTRVKNPDGSVAYTLNRPDDSMEIYAQSDGATTAPRRVFLTQMKDPQGNTVTLHYDAQMRLTSITDALGQSMTLLYADTQHPFRITKVTDPFDRSTSFGYDDQGRLSSITDEIGMTSSFSYDDPTYSDFITSMITPYGTSHYSYESGQGTGPSPYYYRLLKLTDPLGHTQKVEFYQSHPGDPNIPPSAPPAEVPTGTSPPLMNEYLAYRNTFYWNAKAYDQDPTDWSIAKIFHFLHQTGNLSQTSRALESVKLPLQNRVWFTYPGQTRWDHTGDLFQNPAYIAVVVNNDGSRLSAVTHLTYNAQTNVTCRSDPTGRTTKHDYASNGVDLLDVRQGTGDNSCDNNDGAYDTIAQYTYNDQHEPLTYTDAAGQTTHYTYNTAGQLLTVTDALDETTTYNYDGSGYLTSITDANGQTIASFTYDAFGRIATATDAGGETLAYSWDNLNRLTKISYPDGTSRQFVYDRLDLASVTDRLGHTMSYGYDADRNLATVTDPLGNVTHLGHDPDDNLASMTDSNYHATTWNHDLENRLVSKTYADGSSKSYAYTPAAGWLDHVTDPLGQITQFGYTTDGRINSITYQNPQVPTPSVSFTYDAHYPRIIAMTDGTGTTEYNYFPVSVLGANELKSLSVPQPTATIAYAYDVLGRVSSRSIDGISESFAYDSLGRLSGDNNSLGNFTYDYLEETPLPATVSKAESLYNVSYSYESSTDDLRLKKILNQEGGPASLYPQSFDYVTNAPDLVTARTITRKGQPDPQKNFSYVYDADNRLTKMVDESSPNYPTLYKYDAVGNLLSTKGGSPSVTFTASYNVLNQIATANGVTFQYDAAGELVDDGTNTYTWDAAHRLVSVASKFSHLTTHYSYDGLGRRITIKTPSSETYYYLWCGQRLCQKRALYTTKYQPVVQYFHQGEIQSDSTESTPLFYARDRLGSIRNLVDVNGAIRADYAYDPWGNVTNETGDAQASFGYAGMFVDHGTGLNLTLYRAYNPAQYRWLSRDPLGEYADTNLYRYVYDNPLNLTDRLGLQGDWNGFVQTTTNIDPDNLPWLQKIEAARRQNPAIPNPVNRCGFNCMQVNRYIGFWLQLSAYADVADAAFDAPEFAVKAVNFCKGNTKWMYKLGFEDLPERPIGETGLASHGPATNYYKRLMLVESAGHVTLAPVIENISKSEPIPATPSQP